MVIRGLHVREKAMRYHITRMEEQAAQEETRKEESVHNGEGHAQ